MATIKESDKPFHVIVDGGNLLIGAESMDQANAAAEKANKEAESLGIKARYTAVEGAYSAA